MRVLLWISRYIFRHKWSWLSNLTWDWQLKQDAPQLTVMFKMHLRDMGYGEPLSIRDEDIEVDL